MKKNKTNLIKALTSFFAIGGSFVPVCFNNKQSSTLSNNNSLFKNNIAHAYHSMSKNYLSFYYPNVKKENVEPTKINDKDPTLDRFNYVYYSPTTTVNAYHLDSTSVSYKFKEASVNTEWKSASGFAYIAQNDSDPKANTFLDVFAGNIEVANYFSLGDSSRKCTLDSLTTFLKTERSVFTDKCINLSRLYLNDLERDNSVLALLNPTLWSLIISYGEQFPELKIKNIDLSYNKLRVVPNIASIVSDNSDSTWLFEKNDTKYMNHRQKDVTTADERKSGYFDNIDLRHNELTYLELSAYIKRDDVLTKGYYPGLATLMNQIQTDSETKQKTTFGIMLDYNHLTFLYFNQISNHATNASWSSKALDTWYAWSIGSVIEYIKIIFPDIDIPAEFQEAEFTNVLKDEYLTFTVWGTDFKDSLITYLLRFIAPIGQYQTDAIVINPNEAANYLNLNSEISPQINDAWASELAKNTELCKTIAEAISDLHMMSVDIDKCVSLFETMAVLPTPTIFASNDYDGLFYVSIKYGISIIQYLPCTVDLDIEKYSFNELLTSIFSYGTLNKEYVLTVGKFKTDKTPTIIFCCTFIPIVIGILGTSTWRTYLYLKRKQKIRLHKKNGGINEK